MEKNQIIINDVACDFELCQQILPANVDAIDIHWLHNIYHRAPTIAEVYHYAVVKFFENNPNIRLNDRENLHTIKNIMAYANDFGIEISMHSCYNAYKEKVFQRPFPQNQLYV